MPRATDSPISREPAAAANGLRRRQVSVALALSPLTPGLAPAAPTVWPPPAAPLPLPPPPADRPWPGTMTLDVDATDLARRVLRVRQTLPVPGPGPLLLRVPRWLPGYHGPEGDVSGLTGLQMQAGSQRLPWVRDAVDPFAFHVEVPAGTGELLLRFERLAPQRDGQGRATMTESLLAVLWHALVLYPAGHFASGIVVQARLTLPPGWTAGSALRGVGGTPAVADANGTMSLAPVSLETLVDSPLFAGRHHRRVALDDAGAAQPVVLHLWADESESIEPSATQVAAHRALVRQADRLFGRRPWRHYDFLLAQSSRFGEVGLEHHESSENVVRPGYFDDWSLAIRDRELLPHEYVHAWNGKFRRPLDLWTPEYSVPMRNSLLWVYEGLTEYWGHVLAVRAGLTTAEQARDRLAGIAAEADLRAGREWRPLQDTTQEGVIAAHAETIWGNRQRGEDYYEEGLLLWLDADTLIRERSRGRRALDDFAQAFFGVGGERRADGSPVPLTYTFADVVAALNAVQSLDWSAFLRERLDRTGGGAPLDGLRRGGWALAWADTESAFARQSGDGPDDRPDDFRHSVGFSVSADGDLRGLVWDSPAFRAGLTSRHRLIAVNGLAYTAERLTRALKAHAASGAALDLLVRDGDRFVTVSPTMTVGPRHPRLQRLPGAEDRLAAIYAAR